MRPGKLDQRIAIQRETLTDDGYGGQNVSLSTLATVWAEIVPLVGREQEYGQQLQASNIVTFNIRYRDDIKLDDRVLWNGEQYNIRALPPPSTRKMYRMIEAERGVAQ
jgi:SPP1 family predicted phage head-tail adaptor